MQFVNELLQGEEVCLWRTSTKISLLLFLWQIIWNRWIKNKWLPVHVLGNRKNSSISLLPITYWHIFYIASIKSYQRDQGWLGRCFPLEVVLHCPLTLICRWCMYILDLWMVHVSHHRKTLSIYSSLLSCWVNHCTETWPCSLLHIENENLEGLLYYLKHVA